MLKTGPKVAAARLAAVFALLVPAAYVGLLITALTELGTVGGPGAEAAALALVTGTVAICSWASKVASADLVVGRGGEIELLLAHPVSLPALVVARGLAGICTDLFGALFLLPVLAAAAVLWRLPAVAVPLAIATSMLVQIAVSALAQAAQIAIVHLVPVRRRRLVFVLAALLAATGMAAIWMTGSSVLRAPGAAARQLGPWQSGLLAGPGGWITAPLRQLREGRLDLALLALLALAAGAGAALLAAAGVARAAAARGWEQAGPLWAEGQGGSGKRGARVPVIPVSLAGKDWRLLLRDRTRLVTLLALPTLFIGAQVFGSAGWGFSTASPTRLAICAYSLAAYAATFGPLVHLEAERRAFWILRAVPVSIGRLFARKAAFWSLALGGYAAVMYLGLGALAGFAWDGDFLRQGALAVLGAALVAWLAVGLGAAEADLSDDQRSALGLGTAYLFMIVSGLFNLLIIATGADRARAVVLFSIATAIAFATGVQRARDVFDPDALAQRRLSPVMGALGLVLLFLGARAVRLVGDGIGGEAAQVLDLSWMALVGLFTSWHWLRNAGAGPQRRRALAVAAWIAGAAAGLSAALVWGPSAWFDRTLHLGQAGLQEILARGIVQMGLATPLGLPVGGAAGDPGVSGSPGRGRSLLAMAVSIALVAAVVPAPASPLGLLAAAAPALVVALTRRFAPALGLRLLIELCAKAAVG